MYTEQDAEADIRAAGLKAPRITPEMLDLEIASEDYHVFEGSCLTVCALTLQNGFTVTGESACAAPENFNAEIGRKIARDKARDKIWAFLGFRLRDRLSGAAVNITGPGGHEDDDPFVAAIREGMEDGLKAAQRAPHGLHDHLRECLRRRGFLAVSDADLDWGIAHVRGGARHG